MAETLQVHATCVAIDGQAVLLIGPPGSGKSDLALRLIDQPGFGLGGPLKTARLISDDQVILHKVGLKLTAAAPASIKGLLEVRGLGLVSVPVLESAPLALVACLARGGTFERLPDAEAMSQTYLGITVPLIHLDGVWASAPARIRAAIDALNTGNFPACKTS